MNIRLATHWLAAVLSIALGTQSVSPLEMASAYSTIANFGERVESYLIEKIADKVQTLTVHNGTQGLLEDLVTLRGKAQ